MTLEQSRCPSGDQTDYDILVHLALDLRWTWSHGTDAIWKRLDPVLWESTQNPWTILQSVSQEKFDNMLKDPEFILILKTLDEKIQKTQQTDTWFYKAHPKSPLSSIAYFSMEYMLSEALPIYSGGLGNVAGDQLKTASDLGLPVVGVGLLYQQGYFRQKIRSDGSQEALYPYNAPGQLPITPLRGQNGDWLRLEIDLPGYPLFLRAWQAQVGHVKLYLLDSNDLANSPTHRGITGELYGGTPEVRLQQELILGIGGWKMLQAMGLPPQVCHLNEGHAAFVVLERALSLMKERSLSFHQALAITRAGNLFTTHTAVEAGFDRFSPQLVQQYLGRYAKDKLRISFKELMALGRMNPDEESEPFNMAYLATRGSGAINGVSKLHEEVSQRLFSPLFPRWPLNEVPIKHITNGVHMSTWDSEAADEVWTSACGKDRWNGLTERMEDNILKVNSKELWKMRSANRSNLVEYVRTQLPRQLTEMGASDDLIAWGRQALDPAILTLGFARRFATYKRPNLLLHDRKRLVDLLTNKKRPVQLIMAGKAHPADQPGQKLIQEWLQFIQQPDVRPHIVFLSDYDLNIAQQLVRGVDVWINTPSRPWEASGTSGMKVLVNGGINLSELDGWWVEAYSPDLGWALGDGSEHGNDHRWDAFEAETLYNLLEGEVVPEFYNRANDEIPLKWVERIRQSMARLVPRFSACRTVKEYTEQYYLPAALHYATRISNPNYGFESEAWTRSIEAQWGSLRFGETAIETKHGLHVFSAHIFLNKLASGAVTVELYSNQETKDQATKQIEMTLVSPSIDQEEGCHLYHVAVSDARPASDYTIRIIPRLKSGNIPLENNHILWQR